ncbi:CD209 antigen-like protein C [Mytilus californianus]|uniref:CD209 antigen-like protein C n=1 Tax=Mytilus californianus TaxID=6549 RepID=UPI0022462663|nr:CD209 antigen-like protein C [Mytilus californianus]
MKGRMAFTMETRTVYIILIVLLTMGERNLAKPCVNSGCRSVKMPLVSDNLKAPLIAELDVSMVNQQLKEYIDDAINVTYIDKFNDVVEEKQESLKSTVSQINKQLIGMLAWKEKVSEQFLEMSRPCKKGWIKFGGHCYYIGPGKKTWDDSIVDCQRKGSYLVKVEDASENLWLQTVMNANNIDILRIGAHDIHHEGTWRWTSDNTAVDYTNWGGGQPDNAGGSEDCAELWKAASYRWNDRPCTSLLRYICER